MLEIISNLWASEFISEETGRIFKIRNADDLKEKLEVVYATQFDYPVIAEASPECYNQEIYYENMIKTYTEC